MWEILPTMTSISTGTHLPFRTMTTADWLDGGCVFSYNPEFGKRYVCMLCAICLETLEEIYPWSLLERIAMLHPEESASRIEKIYEETRKKRKEYLCNPYRREMLQMLGVE